MNNSLAAEMEQAHCKRKTGVIRQICDENPGFILATTSQVPTAVRDGYVHQPFRRLRCDIIKILLIIVSFLRRIMNIETCGQNGRLTKAGFC
jgi:hypothetical protein